MKILLVNGSPNVHGCVDAALNIVADQLKKENIETEIISLANIVVNDCLGCGVCNKLDRCIQDDIVNIIGEKVKEADGFIFGSPTYYAHPSGRLLSLMDRLSTAYGEYLSHKPAAAITTARRGGNVAAFDVVNKHFSINNMPIIGSTYWNQVYGTTPSDIYADKEGINTLNNLAKNMAWILRCIECGKQNGIDKPRLEKEAMNFHH